MKILLKLLSLTEKKIPISRSYNRFFFSPEIPGCNRQELINKLNSDFNTKLTALEQSLSVLDKNRSEKVVSSS